MDTELDAELPRAIEDDPEAVPELDVELVSRDEPRLEAMEDVEPSGATSASRSLVPALLERPLEAVPLVSREPDSPLDALSDAPPLELHAESMAIVVKTAMSLRKRIERSFSAETPWRSAMAILVNGAQYP